MEKFNSWQEMLQKTSYATKDKYMDRDIYPNTGSIAADWEAIHYTISILRGTIKTDSIDEYFYWLNFMKGQVIDAGIDYLEKTLPPIHEAIIAKTTNFVVRGNLGSIVPGYNLIIPLDHRLSMS